MPEHPPLRTPAVRVLAALGMLLAFALVSIGVGTLGMYWTCRAQGQALVVERIAWFGLSKSYRCEGG